MTWVSDMDDVAGRVAALAETTQGDSAFFTPREVIRAVEAAWDLVIPDRLLDGARDRAALVEACVAEVRRTLRSRRGRAALPAAARLVVRLEPPPSRGGGAVVRSGVLTAYDVDEVLEGARRWGSGARLTIVAADEASRPMAEALAARAAAHSGAALAVEVRDTDSKR